MQSQAKVNSKFTIVANPFTLPFEEIMLLISEIHRNTVALYCTSFTGEIQNSDFGFIGGIDSTGRICVPEEGKLFRGKSLTIVSDSYDTEDFDLSLSQTGWLAFEESRTTIREYLFQIYKILRATDKQTKFYRPMFNDYSSGLRVAYVDGSDITIKRQHIEYELKSHGIGSIFSGGGRSQEFLTVLPIPSTISTFQLISTVLQLTDRDAVKYIITNKNYSYRFINKHIETSPAPIIDFLETEYDCLLIEGSPEENLPLIGCQLAAHLEVRPLSSISSCDYKNIRSAMSDGSHSSVWLFVFDFMNYMNDTEILSGSHHDTKINSESRQSTIKSIRIGL